MVLKMPRSTQNATVLRPTDAGDHDFLFTLYQSGRAEEMASWGWEPAQQVDFLRFQFGAQQRHYASAFPNAELRIVLEGGAPVGGILTAANEDTLHLIDLSLLPDARGRGIGTGLLTALKEEAKKKKRGVTLSVRKENPAAIRLYRRLGFYCVGESDTDLQMRWSCEQDH